MSRFTRELRVVPTVAWIIAWVAYACSATAMFFLVTLHDPQMAHWPLWGKVLFVYGLFLLLAAYIALVGYVYGDAKRRQMRHVMWTLLAIFIPNAIGIILYFILRDPLAKNCSGCGNPVKAGFVFCPNCGISVQPACPNCGRGVDPSWTNCPHCGLLLPAPSAGADRSPEGHPHSQTG